MASPFGGSVQGILDRFRQSQPRSSDGQSGSLQQSCTSGRSVRSGIVVTSGPTVVHQRGENLLTGWQVEAAPSVAGHRVTGRDIHAVDRASAASSQTGDLVPPPSDIW
jgi:hypothetical protein